MKALTLTQPWATLVVVGAKGFETRSWRTTYTGELVIHAAKSFPAWCREMVADEYFRSALLAAGYPDAASLPLGYVVGHCLVLECYPVDRIFKAITAQERAFGDWASGRWAWQLGSAVRWQTPVPAKGSLGLWNWQRAPVNSSSTTS